MTNKNPIEINPQRIEYLLNIWNLSPDKFIERINGNGQRDLLSKDNIFQNKTINFNQLKRIDKLFEKGLPFYIDPTPIQKEFSIFYRKKNIRDKPNEKAIKIITRYEEAKYSLSALCKLSNLRIERKLHSYTLKNNPQDVANEINNHLKIKYRNNTKNFLKALIQKLSDFNILVLEFLVSWNEKEKSNIEGFFIEDNVIVLKQQYVKREIFTLAHELGHYLLGEETVTDNVFENTEKDTDVNNIEKWCNNFAYYFLVPKDHKIIDDLSNADASNNFHKTIIEEIATKNPISQLALYTRMRILNKISQEHYKDRITEIDNFVTKQQQDKKDKNEQDKQMGKKQFFSPRKPIYPSLLNRIIQSAYYEGVIDEIDIHNELNKIGIKQDIDKILD